MKRNWIGLAKCSSMNPLRFDLTDRRTPEADRAAEAKRLCSGCKVVQLCAREAVDNTEYRLQTTTRAGIWLPDTGHKDYKDMLAAVHRIAAGASC